MSKKREIVRNFIKIINNNMSSNVLLIAYYHSKWKMRCSFQEEKKANLVFLLLEQIVDGVFSCTEVLK